MENTTMRPISLFFVFLLFSPCGAFPTQPGNCPQGEAAVTGHIAQVPNAVTGPLSSQGFFLTVDDNPVTEGASVDLTVNVPHTIAITTSTSTFRGHLIRVNVASSNFVPGTNSGTPAVCGTTAGIGHTDNTDKTAADGTLTLTEALSGIPVDVTVVVAFNPVAAVNEYYYSSFTFNVVTAVTGAPTPSVTTVSPTAGATSPAPVAAPMVAPVQPPVSDVTAAPVAAPLSIPVPAPTPPPVTAPVSVPVPAPGSTQAPVVVLPPVTAPVSTSVPAPAAIPVSAPVPISSTVEPTYRYTTGGKGGVPPYYYHGFGMMMSMQGGKGMKSGGEKENRHYHHYYKGHGHSAHWSEEEDEVEVPYWKRHDYGRGIW